MSPAPNPSDEDVLRRIRAGDTDAYEIIMRRYNQRLYRAVRAILRGEADVEDVLQNTYIRAFEHLDQFEGNAAFSTWLTRIAIREALAIRRREKVRSQASEMRSDMPSPVPMATPETAALQTEVRALIEAAVDKLPESYRLVFVLREMENLSTAETAQCLDISEENVKVRLHRSRSLLRSALYESVGRTFERAYAFEAPRCNRVVATVLSHLKSATV